MQEERKRVGILGWLKNVFIGKARNPLDRSVFHNISLIAFFAWVGLGADGLSSSCYGPPEAFIALGEHYYLGLLVAAATAITIFIISESYNQVIELFPTGGGGYLVASQMLGPAVGMISGCALLIDYILTITLSVASGADAVFSFLPAEFLVYKLGFAVIILLVLILLNLRGVKESVTILMPIFLAFVVTHVFIIFYALAINFFGLPQVFKSTAVDIKSSVSELGLFGMLFLLLKAYSLGAGTYTGIEAVSNGMPILRDPKVKTAKETMRYMVVSLIVVVFGLMFAYALYHVHLEPGKTLNAVLFEKVIGGWGLPGYVFVLIALISEAAILFVAAQTGFLGGPRVLANMAADRWMPKRFALLSDRLVTLNGIMIMGLGALVLMVMTNGSVGFLVILYSINVFITFTFTQLGLVKHWWGVRYEQKQWRSKIFASGTGLALTTFILVAVTLIKFGEGGWITLLITGTLVVLMLLIRAMYDFADRRIKQMDALVEEVESTQPVREIPVAKKSDFNPGDKTAIVLVKDFNAIGLKTIFHIFPSFLSDFKNFVFVQVGLIDAGAFRGTEELDKVKFKVESELKRYTSLMERHGYGAESLALYGIDTGEEIEKAVPELLRRYPNATFFGGQIIFPRFAIISKLLHNYTLLSVQKQLYKMGIHLYVLPIEIV